MRRIRSVLAAALVAASLVTPGASAQQPEGLTASDNVRFVTNLKFQNKYPQSSRRSVDMDFTTTEVVKLSEGATGDPVCVVDEGQADGCARDDAGEIVYQTEEREFAYVGTYMTGLQTVDITDPENPVVVAVYDCAIAQSDVDVFHRPDLGRTFLTYSSDEISGQTNFSSRCHRDNGVMPGNYGAFIVDITDPRKPESVSFIAFPRGSHQLSVHPGGRWVYSSPGALVNAQGAFHVSDVTDPEKPGPAVTVPLVTGLDAHDIIFGEGGNRAYVAALSHTVIMDTTNPGKPVAIGRILDPTVNIHHEAHPYTTVDELTGIRHTFLLLSDEFAGASGNEVCPGGGIHVYDITGHLERAPVKVGLYLMPHVGRAEGAPQGTAGLRRCTAHVMQMHPEHDIATVAWYAAGTRVLDLSGILGASAGVTEQTGSQGAGIKEIGYARFNDGDVWATKTNRIEDDGTFYLYSADTARMLDVFHVDLRRKPAGVSLSPGGGFTTRNVEWIRNIAAHAGTSGGTRVGDYYYMTDPRGVYIYDISNPALPVPVGALPAIQSTTHVVFAQEEPETNGRILLVNAIAPGPSGAPPANGWLVVVDVRNKSAPTVVGSLNLYDHTWSCVLDCTYAIGRTGPIVDLRDPANPVQVGNWRNQVSGASYMHDFTEVRPGYLIGSGQPTFYLDMTEPPVVKEIARISPGFHSLGYHGAAWANDGTDPLLLICLLYTSDAADE